VRRHAKASSAGSNAGSGDSRGLLGRVFSKPGALLIGVAALATLVLGVSLASGAAPTVTIENASEVEYTSATAKGEVNPADHETLYLFQVVSKEQFEASEWAEAETQTGEYLEAGTGLTQVEGHLSGLRPNTTYHLRLTAENSEGETDEAVAPATFTTKPVAVPTVSIEAPSGVTTTSAHFVGHVKPNAPNPQASTSPAEQNAFFTEWTFRCTPSCPTFLHGQLAADNTSHEVSASATELVPGTHYEVRLIAHNAGGEVEAGPESFTAPALPPKISSPTTEISATEATLRAQINPGGAPTTYHFEYLTDAQFQSESGYASPNTISTPESASIGADNENHEVATTITGLTPGTTYHYRLVATNTSPGNPVVKTPDHTFFYFSGSSPGEPQTCPNEQLRIEDNSLALPDCRSYEQVSPPFKFGQPINGFPQVAADGSRVAFRSIGAFGEPGNDASTEAGIYVATRAGSGWSTLAVNPPAAQFRYDETYDYSSDLSHSLFISPPAPPAKSIDDRVEIRRLDGALVEVGPLVPPETVAAWTPNDAGPGGLNGAAAPPFTYRSASGDLSHVFFDMEHRAEGYNWQWPGDDTESGFSLYEYAGTGNREPELVGVDNQTTLAAAAAAARKPHINEAAQQISKCGIAFGGVTNVFSREGGEGYNAVSSSGETVFFTAIGHSSGCDSSIDAPEFDEIYARSNREKTIAISEPTAGPSGDCELCDESDPDNAFFAGASKDGSKVFFYSEQKLLPGAEGSSLYEYRFDGPDPHQKLSLLATDLPSESGEPRGGVVRVSEDGSHVYFVSTAKLATNTDANGEEANTGDNNLYAYDTDNAQATFIANLSPNDSRLWSPTDYRPAEATPDGHFLLFASASDLTPDSSGSAEQLYRYEAPNAAHPTGSLMRVSVGANGFNENGNSAAPPPSVYAPEYSALFRDYSSIPRGAPLSVSISTDGSKVFFESPTALTPGALDDTCALELFGECSVAEPNVYEWENGQVHLISDGLDTHAFLVSPATHLLGATPSGSDVFFTSADSLVSQDTDALIDVYDAHAGGGFPAAANPASCQGDTCQGAASQAPSIPGAATSSHSGPGNQKSAHGHKHKKRKVRKHHKKHKRAANGKGRTAR